MRLLIVGGAGYVGSHCAKRLIEEGHDVVTYDNLSTGHQHAVSGSLIVGDILDTDHLVRVLKTNFDAVLNFAAKLNVGESITDPLSFFHTNVGGTLSLLSAMKRTFTRQLVVSSTCAIYGEPANGLIQENTPKRPINPYGQSKLMVEEILTQAARSGDIQSVALRYFNAAGAAMDSSIGEDHQPETHIIPLAIQAALNQAPFSVFGTDYSTPDGTCIRDYVHVDDLADAHVKALEWMTTCHDSGAFNLGSGTGTSVNAILDAIDEHLPSPIIRQMTQARPGDPPILVADPRHANETLGWSTKYTLNDIITSAIAWETKRNDV